MIYKTGLSFLFLLFCLVNSDEYQEINIVGPEVMVFVSINKGSIYAKSPVKSDSIEYRLESQVEYEDHDKKFWINVLNENVLKLTEQKIDDICGCIGTQPVIKIKIKDGKKDTLVLLINECGIDYSRGKILKNSRTYIADFDIKGATLLKNRFSRIRKYFFKDHKIECGSDE